MFKKKKEVMAENFPNLVKDVTLQSQETELIPSRIKPTRSMPRHIIIQLLQTKGKESLESRQREMMHYL